MSGKRSGFRDFFTQTVNERADFVDERLRIERLVDEVISTYGRTSRSIVGVLLAAQHDDTNTGGLSLDSLAYFIAVGIAQNRIKENDGWVFRT